VNPVDYKTLNVLVPFILQISQGKQNYEIKGCKYAFNACWWFEITCVLELCGLKKLWMHQNKGHQNNFACEVANFYGSHSRRFLQYVSFICCLLITA